MGVHGSVTNEIAHYIRKNIRAGNWGVGDKLPSENELCQELGVSRVSVRSALQQFIALGILQSVRGKGTFLVSSDLSMFAAPATGEAKIKENVESMKQILEFRSMVEPDVCAKVATTVTPEILETLDGHLQKMRDYVGKSAEFVEADVDFHLEICRASGNPFITSVMTDIFRKRADLGNMLNLATGYYGGIYYHGLLMDAFRKKDPKRARAIMAEHLQRGIDDLSVDNASPDAAAQPESEG